MTTTVNAPTGMNRRLSYQMVAGTPTTPDMTAVEITGNGLQASQAPITDKSRKGMRSTGSTRLGNWSVAGDVSFVYKHEVLRALIAGVARNEYVANTVTFGGSVPKPVLFEAIQTDAALPYGEAWADCHANTMELEVTDGDNASIKIGYVGREYQFNDTPLDATPKDAASHEAIIHTDTKFYINGEVAGYLSNFKISVNNNITAGFGLSSNLARSLTPGTCVIGGSFVAVPETGALIKSWISGQHFPLRLETTSTNNGVKTMEWFEVPNALITKPDRQDAEGLQPFTLTFVADPTSAGVAMKFGYSTITA